MKKNTHHTPQMYLRRFAVGGLLMTQRTGHAAKPVGTPVVGVINRFYTLNTRDGGSDEVEDKLMVLEGRAKRVFDRVDAVELPLTTEEKTVMAEFVGFQMCRGMQYRELGQWVLDQSTPALRERVRNVYRKRAPDRIAEADTYDLTPLMSQNQVVRSLVRTGQLMTNVLVNMRWQIVRWPKPVLLSSDHPAICWHRPHESSPWGVSDAVEVRMPLSPTQALIASWHDGPDVGEVLRGDKIAAMTMNYHTERHAVDWRFWRPDTDPVRGHPLHDLALSGKPPASSERWQFVHELAQEMIEDGEDRIRSGKNRVAILEFPQPT